MAVVVRLERWPRTRRIPPAIRAAVLEAMRTELWPAVQAHLEGQISMWAGKPEFYEHISVSGMLYRLLVKVDRRTKIGKIFVWVDEGTSSEGDLAHRYPIPVGPDHDFMRFVTPYDPKTLPPAGWDALNYSPDDPVVFHRRKLVMHTGIVPREYTRQTFEKFADDSNPKGFMQTLKRAVRRTIAKGW